MSKFYAKLSAENIVESVIWVNDSQAGANLVELDSYDTALMGKKYVNGLFEDVPVPVIEQEPSALDIIGQQLVEKDLQILELQNENEMLGQQIVDHDLRLLMGGL